jgi:hypothetical protein
MVNHHIFDWCCIPGSLGHHKHDLHSALPAHTPNWPFMAIIDPLVFGRPRLNEQLSNTTMGLCFHHTNTAQMESERRRSWPPRFPADYATQSIYSVMTIYSAIASHRYDMFILDHFAPSRYRIFSFPLQRLI